MTTFEKRRTVFGNTCYSSVRIKKSHCVEHRTLTFDLEHWTIWVYTLDILIYMYPGYPDIPWISWYEIWIHMITLHLNDFREALLDWKYDNIRSFLQNWNKWNIMNYEPKKFQWTINIKVTLITKVTLIILVKQYQYDFFALKQSWDSACSFSWPNQLNYNPINNWTNMSWNCTAYFSDARTSLLMERVIVLCVYAAHACSFNYW